MRLSDFKSLIAQLPTEYQAFTSKRTTWESFIDRDDPAGAALRSIFGANDDAKLSRGDLRRLAKESQLERFILATLLWGYPQGMRGNHVANLIRHLCPLTQLLADARDRTICDWSAHYEKTAPIQGIGLSTYTKFLCFLDVQVHGIGALILDDRIVRVAKEGIFVELEPLRKLRTHNAPKLYPAYLKHIEQLSADLDVPAENIEFFLFEYGLNLKAPIPSSCFATAANS